MEDELKVKVSDFGLAKGLEDEKTYYKPSESKVIPVRWY